MYLLNWLFFVQVFGRIFKVLPYAKWKSDSTTDGRDGDRRNGLLRHPLGDENGARSREGDARLESETRRRSFIRARGRDRAKRRRHLFGEQLIRILDERRHRCKQRERSRLRYRTDLDDVQLRAEDHLQINCPKAL